MESEALAAVRRECYVHPVLAARGGEMKFSRKRIVALVAILVALILGGAWGSQIADDNGTPEAGFTWDEG